MLERKVRCPGLPDQGGATRDPIGTGDSGVLHNAIHIDST